MKVEATEGVRERGKENRRSEKMELILLSDETKEACGVMRLEEEECWIYDPVTRRKKFRLAGAKYDAEFTLPGMSEEKRLSYCPKAGALFYCTTDGLVYLGDGETVGGKVFEQASSAVNTTTEFEVFATDAVIPGGTVDPDTGIAWASDVPAGMEQKLKIRCDVLAENSDVVIDWGDGVRTVLRNGEFESFDASDWNVGEMVYVVSHKYTVPGRYRVVIRGKEYFGFQQVEGFNIVSRIFSKGYPLAECVQNLSVSCRWSPKLQTVVFPTGAQMFANVHNAYGMFANCPNLVSVTNCQTKFRLTRDVSSMFQECFALKKCDFQLPANALKKSNCGRVFYKCVNLEANIASLFPDRGFEGKTMELSGCFSYCGKLTGTVPAEKLWDDTSIRWNARDCFTGCSAAIREQVPTPWGGTLEEFNAVSGEWSKVVSGDGNKVLGDYSSADGYANKVSGTISSAHGLSNDLSGDSTHAIGESNELAAFGACAIGSGNEIVESGQGAIAIGGSNKGISGIDAVVIGAGNRDVSGNRSVTIGFNAGCDAEQGIAIGTKAGAAAKNRGGVFLPGHEIRVRELDPLGDGETEFLPCYRHTYRGQSLPFAVERTLTGDRAVTPDVNHMSRLVLKGTGTATLVPNNLMDGDKLEIIYNANEVTLNYPASWIGTIEGHGVTVVEIERFLGKTFIATKYHE